MDVTQKLLDRYQTLIIDTMNKLSQTNNTAEIIGLADRLAKLTYTFSDLSVIKSAGGKIIVPEDALGKLNLAD